MQDLGKLIFIVGIAMALLGLVIWFGRFPRLPGDIVVEKQNFRFYFPLATSLVVSAVLTLLLWLFRR